MKKYLFFVVLSIFLSCTEEETKNQNSDSNLDYLLMNTYVQKRIDEFDGKINNEDQLKSLVFKYVAVRKIELYNANFENKVEIKIPKNPYYNDSENAFLLALYNELANAENYMILEVIKNKKQEIVLSSFSNDFKDQTNFVLVSVEKTANMLIPYYNLTNSYDKSGKVASLSKARDYRDYLRCMGGYGKDIGKAIVTGVVVGGIAGAKVGLAGGTVALPGFGTITGGVGGAVLGAASGAVGGAATTLVWAGVECLRFLTISKVEEVYLKDVFFKDEMNGFILSEEEVKLFNQLLNVPREGELILTQ